MHTFFTKLLRPLVAYWRRQCIKVVLYLDDGFGFAEYNELYYEHAQVVVPNKDKSIWKSSQTIEWLGFLWDLKLCILRVPEKLELSVLISALLRNSHRVRARTLAKISGKIIAMTPAVGFITQIMTRCMFSALNEKLDWNNNLNIYHTQDCIRELMFWKLNISSVKPVVLLEKEYAYDIFTDASDVGAADFIKHSHLVMLKTWLKLEAGKSSTWREIKAVELCL